MNRILITDPDRWSRLSESPEHDQNTDKSQTKPEWKNQAERNHMVGFVVTPSLCTMSFSASPSCFLTSSLNTDDVLSLTRTLCSPPPHCRMLSTRPSVLFYFYLGVRSEVKRPCKRNLFPIAVAFHAVNSPSLEAEAKGPLVILKQRLFLSVCMKL